MEPEAMRATRWAFFFSSRRRHTRYIGDWSSDVCSSDLGSLYAHISSKQDLLYETMAEGARAFHARSEERRVGKECRSRGPGANLYHAYEAVFCGLSGLTLNAESCTQANTDCQPVQAHIH